MFSFMEQYNFYNNTTDEVHLILYKYSSQQFVNCKQYKMCNVCTEKNKSANELIEQEL